MSPNDLVAAEKALFQALTRLYNPDYRPEALLYDLIGCSRLSGPTAVQAALIQGIEALKPSPDVAPDAQPGRFYDVLYHRFVVKLTQEQTAELMNMSVRQLNRVQREAVHALALHLWNSRQRETILSRAQNVDTDAGGGGPLALQASDWDAQVRRELASLEAAAPGMTANVDEVLEGIITLGGALTTVHELRIGFIQPGLVAAFHPSILRQVLISVIQRLAALEPTAQMTLFASLQADYIKITVAASVEGESLSIEGGSLRDIWLPESMTLEVDVQDKGLFVSVRVPTAEDKITVLVVDDNADMVHFYRRCIAGTRYNIVAAADDRDLMSVVARVCPAVIVMDVLLPHVDGWELVMHLHQNERTRYIPIIVCSVVREEELALSLGAAYYLAKPIRPRQFTQALDQVLSQASVRERSAPENSVAPC